jgi:predicted TPR repeat methyltransferase
MNPFDLVKAQHMAGHVKEAAENYRKILADEPAFVPAINMLGNALVDLGDYEEAIKEYERALAIEPEYFAAHYNKGNALFKLDRLDEAAAAYRRAIEIKPDFPNAHFNLGNAYLDLGRPADAIREYERTLEISPEDESTHFNLGKALAMMHRDDEAMDAYRRAIRHNPSFLRAHSEMGQAASEHFNAGMTLFTMGRHEEAEQAFRRALAIEPDNGRVRECLGRVLLELERREEAIELVRAWLRQDPDDAQALHLLAAWSSQDAPPRASDEYIRAEFDRLAGDFDNTLARIQYLGPILVAEALRRHEVTARGAYAIADLGCGTGLAAPILRPLARELVGVDLSEQMIRMAAAREVYDELVNAELSVFLRGQRGRFDVIIAADTFIYFGDLAEPCAAAAEALTDGGWFVFTTELLHADESAPEYTLNTTGRYSHSEAYVRRMVEESGLMVVGCQQAYLRMEGARTVQGLVVVARKGPAG